MLRSQYAEIKVINMNVHMLRQGEKYPNGWKKSILHIIQWKNSVHMNLNEL